MGRKRAAYTIIGLAVSACWLTLVTIYINDEIGWDNLVLMLPHDIAISVEIAVQNALLGERVHAVSEVGAGMNFVTKKVAESRSRSSARMTMIFGFRFARSAA